MSDPIERPSAAARLPLERLRALCLSQPNATERISHGEPAWFVRKSPQFLTMADHHHDDRVAFWAAAPAGAQQDWVARDPARFFVPPYVGGRGWIGVYLDVEQNWDDIADIVDDAYRTVAVKRPV
ncbi:MmcQ/YjbR family DNA-binding protein [Antrihabitans sp. YC2-6]|uniref:MmcQ/YjbR family DNA-binding protein n=1 Tax=Antrihabitans sp. YC2-6 TaxID=2799498 RepID=UPI0018F67D09|nr:MmcQ/YjbR family DNA-binding protein [Antrihabitans sp. YC2-6]MBJ8344172.1 MmcQ/YjbR family DNA-binding protein [Antrihabitans sp. YC2-6]